MKRACSPRSDAVPMMRTFEEVPPDQAREVPFWAQVIKRRVTLDAA
jgi:hypothetical protein